MKKFNTDLTDSQATDVIPVKPKDFEFGEYAAYAEELNKRCAVFWTAKSGVAVYRRVRVADCFASGCKDMKKSLENQLGALKKSMKYKADVPNFLEPWYGIGTIASAFGGEYAWPEGGAPVIKPRFKNIDEALKHNPVPVANTGIGKHTLEMIEYFMDKTKGMLPVSLTDTQSPLNIAGLLLPLDQLFTALLTEPEKVVRLFDLIADRSIEFNREQVRLIGDALVYPGHGFASSAEWAGLGMSDDNAVMISPEQYLQVAAPPVEKICSILGGPAFHSCGDWSNWIEAVLKIRGILMADGAFSAETDPGATDNIEAFHQFAGTGVVLNARIVGSAETIEKQARRLWCKGMKLIVVTYCQSPDEQSEAYDLIHHICC